MSNGELLKIGYALLFGAIAVSVPAIVGNFASYLAPNTIILIQAGLMTISGFFIFNILRARLSTVEAIVGGVVLIASGFIIASSVTTITVTEEVARDELFTENFNDTGELNGLEEVNSNLRLVSSPGEGYFQSDPINGDNITDIEFDRITSRVDTINPADHTVTLRVRTYKDGDIVDSHTYDINESGLTSHDVNKIQTVDIPFDTFTFRVDLDSTSQQSPTYDYARFEFTEQTKKASGNSELIEYLSWIVFVFGGIIVILSGLAS